MTTETSKAKSVTPPPKPKFKKKRKKKSKIYFGTPVQNAIIRYNASDNPAIKNRIYKEHIQFAFNKLAENLIHTFKFYYFDYPLDESIGITILPISFVDKKIYLLQTQY